MADDDGRNPTGHNNRFVSGGGSVSSLLSFSLFKLCRGTGRNWSVLAFRFAALPSPPIPRPPQTPALAVIQPIPENWIDFPS